MMLMMVCVSLYRGDVLDKPLRSDEFGPLAKLMVGATNLC